MRVFVIKILYNSVLQIVNTKTCIYLSRTNERYLHFHTTKSYIDAQLFDA